tara:strand:- start:41 stop:652 length:612 start_codon:yes stop_codon:yes gene_type:complete
MKSLSEIDTVSKRASRAIGFSWGIAEEVGKNIRLLELFGFKGVKNLNVYYREKKIKKFEKLKVIKKKNKPVKSYFCPIISGTSFLDQAKNFENSKEIKIEKIAYPILFIPFVSRASAIIGKRILLKFGKNNFLFNLNQNIFSDFKDKEIIKLTNSITLKFIENTDNFLEKEWKELYNLSETIFVEENENLKNKSAGAGLTDND